MKTKIKRHSRSVLSVILAISILISCLMAGIIATDAANGNGGILGANANDEVLGDTTYYYLLISTDSNPSKWTKYATSETQSFTVTPSTLGLSSFETGKNYYVGISSSTSYTNMWSQGGSSAVGTTAGSISGASPESYNIGSTTYHFAHFSLSSAVGSVTVTVNHDSGSPGTTTYAFATSAAAADTWTVAGASGGKTAGGQSDTLFTQTWNTTLTQNDMTNTSGTTWTWTKNNVTLEGGKILCKVVKNHSWDTAYPTNANQESSSLAAGQYNVTITFDSSTKAVTITATSIAKSTLTVGSPTGATITATYNGTSATNGGTISNIPQGATVTVNVTPATSKMCSGVTYTYSGTTKDATKSGSSWTFAMPAAATTVNATITDVTLKKIYFNNSYTLYGSVYAYVYDKDSSDNHTYEYLGPRPGTTMTKLDNSNIWYIEVPSDVDNVEFISGDGKTTGELTIPWNDYTYPKYTAPYNYNAPTEDNGGAWGNYIYGSNNKRTNEYTVSKGSTMDADNLFTGITATMYDYYTDGEITAFAGTADDNGASGAPNGWIKGINNNEYTWTDYKNSRVPYKTLNAALSAYADADKTRDNNNWSNPSQPKYGVTYPLYFGDLNTNEGDSNVNDHVATLYNWHFGANNSNGLNATNNAAIGLSGKTLGNDKTIHYYKSGATDENGAPMAMFDEDFLSGENNSNKALASILRTAAFPVRKEENVGATTTYQNKIYMSAGGWTGDSAVIFAHFQNGVDKEMTSDGTYLVCDIPTGATGVTFVRMPNGSSSVDWGNAWNQSNDYAVETSTSSASRLYTFATWDQGESYGPNNSKKKSTFTKGDIPASYGTTTGGHTYYEFDSTNGKDNAYIESINKSDKTATINYYDSSQDKKVHSANGTDGFFPFNRNAYVPDQGAINYAQDLGFGMKLTIPFTLNENGLNEDGTAQTFDFSGDDDLWVFVDDKLVLDLGGAHGRTTGSINFNTKKITANNTQVIPSGVSRNGSFASGFNTNKNYVHTMTIYYMERGMIDSNLKFGFSFHAIPNQFWIDKKIRTKDIINAGFYQPNGQQGLASNQDDTLTQQEGRFISKFEASYQNESFTVTHKYGATAAGATTPASGMSYTIDNDTNTYTTPLDGTYPIKHDLGNAFIGQFTKGQYFNLKESYGNNKYVYTPVFSVWDQANNNQAITPTGDNTSGYTFQFNPTTTAATGAIENTNIKARFENFMDAHTLTLKKELTNAVDPEAAFTLKVTFDFENDGNYIAYPLYCDVDGARQQLSNTGTITIKPGQILEIEEIPQNAKIKVEEVMTDTVDGYRYDSISLTQGGTTMNPNSTVTKGVTFTMHGSDIVATVKNKKPDNKYTITYVYPSYGASPKTESLYGNQSYTVSGVFTKEELQTYMTLSGSSIVFKDDVLKRTFINSKAPYEDNFMQNLSFASSPIDETGKGWDANGDYSCSVTAPDTADYTINAYFNLPYAVNESLVPQESGTTKKIAYNSSKTAYGSKDITCFDWYVTSGPTNKKQTGTPVFVNAPLIVYTDVNNENTKKYFQYWSVKSQSVYGKQSAEYTRCYDYEFNLALFMDCIIEPVYADTWAQATGNPNPPTTYDNYKRYNPELQITGTAEQNISISFLENSRNQYNNDGGGTRTGSAADVIYSDFLLNFNYNSTDGLKQLNTLPADTKKAGLVVEAVDYMQTESGSTRFDYNKNYSGESDYTKNEASQKTAITNWLQGTADKPTGCANAQFDVQRLDNKNCIQYYYALNNRKNSDGILLNTLQNRYKVFRAYAYIGDFDEENGLTNVELSTPVYFTIYDVGSHGLADNATKPNS